MPEVPRIKASEAIGAFLKAGFQQVRKRGSHLILKKEGHRLLLSVPCHRGKILGLGLLDSLIDASGLTREEFIALLD